MPHITSTLGNEPGIQYNRPNDKTGGTGIAPINNVFVGQFRRGRTDKMLDITKQNIRAVLGYDPKNPDYVAVQDALDTNIASVKVLRIHSSNAIGCEGAISSCTIDLSGILGGNGETAIVTVGGMTSDYPGTPNNFVEWFNSVFENIAWCSAVVDTVFVINFNIASPPNTANTPVSIVSNKAEISEFGTPKQWNEWGDYELNPTFGWDSANKTITFCLKPSDEQPE